MTVCTRLVSTLDDGTQNHLDISVADAADAHMRQMAVLRAQAQLAAVAGSDNRVVVAWDLAPWHPAPESDEQGPATPAEEEEAVDGPAEDETAG